MSDAFLTDINTIIKKCCCVSISDLYLSNFLNRIDGFNLFAQNFFLFFMHDLTFSFILDRARVSPSWIGSHGIRPSGFRLSVPPEKVASSIPSRRSHQRMTFYRKNLTANSIIYPSGFVVALWLQRRSLSSLHTDSLSSV